VRFFLSSSDKLRTSPDNVRRKKARPGRFWSSTPATCTGKGNLFFNVRVCKAPCTKVQGKAMSSHRHNVRVASFFLSLLCFDSFRRLRPVNDVLSVHHGGTMLVVTRVATPSPPQRRSDCRRTRCGRVHWLPPHYLKSAADRRQRCPWRAPPREVGAAAAAAAAAAATAATTDASPSCATLRGGEGGERVRGGAGGGGGARRLQGVAATTTVAAAAASTWGSRLPRGRRGCRPPPRPPPKLGARW